MTDVLDLRSEVSLAAILRARLVAYVDLSKPRIAAMVLVATALGFYLALPGELSVATLPLFLHTILGTALVAGGANALNQLLESEHDACMERTRMRPLPSGRLTGGEVFVVATLASAGGVLYLACFATVMAGVTAAVSLLLYVFAYTPLKRVTPLCVFVGAVPGALPPVIGWAAVSGDLSIHAILPFAILYFWQLPHFAAISWLYRDDYTRAGYVLLSVTDRSGARVNLHMMTHTFALMAVSILPTFYGVSGVWYGVGAVALGLGFLGFGVAFVLKRNSLMARYHLLASVVYLPLLFALMMIDKAPRG